MGNAHSPVLEERITSYSGLGELHSGTYQDKPCIAFLFHTDVDSLRESAETAVAAHKKMRHPAILHYVAAVSLQSRLCLVTEYAESLELRLASISHDQLVQCAYEVLTALHFIHQHGLSHNNVSMSALFVVGRQAPTFRLAALHDISDTPKRSGMSKYPMPPVLSNVNEEEDDDDDTREEPIHALDVWHCAFLFGELLQHTDALSPLLKKMRNSDARRRPTAQEVLHNPFFAKNVFVKAVKQLDNFRAKDDSQKVHFYRGLERVLPLLSESDVKCSVLPRLFHADTLMNSASITFWRRALDKNSGLFSAELMSETIVPHLLSLFEKKERALRTSLLHLLAVIVERVEEDVLLNTLIPLVLDGVYDSDELLASASITQATAAAIALGAQPAALEMINATIIPLWKRVALTDPGVSVRVATVQALGDLLLRCKGVRASAIIRILVEVLADDSLHADISAAVLHVIGAARSMFPPAVVCRRVLPALTPLLMSSVDDVRVHVALVMTQLISDVGGAVGGAAGAGGSGGSPARPNTPVSIRKSSSAISFVREDSFSGLAPKSLALQLSQDSL